MYWNELDLTWYELGPACFLTLPGLAQQAVLKSTKAKLDLLTDVDAIIGGKGIRGRICHAIYRFAKANNKYIKVYNKNNNHVTSIGR